MPAELVLPPLEWPDELRLRWSHDTLYGRASARLEAMLREAPGERLIRPPETSQRLEAPAGPGWHTLAEPVAGGLAISHALPAPATLVVVPEARGMLLQLETAAAGAAEAAILLVLPIAGAAPWEGAFTVQMLGAAPAGLRLWVEYHHGEQRLPLHPGEPRALPLSGVVGGASLECSRWGFPPPEPAMAALRAGGSAHLVLRLPIIPGWRLGLLDARLVA